MTATAQTVDTTPTRLLFQLSMRQLWAVVAVAVPAVALVGGLNTVDLAYHVRAGDIMLNAHRLIGHDSFTFTANGMPWLDQQWGAQVLFASVYRLLGWAGLALVHSLLVGAAFGFVFLACRRMGASPRIAAGTAVAAFVASISSLSLRPQLLGAVLFAVCLWIV